MHWRPLIFIVLLFTTTAAGAAAGPAVTITGGTVTAAGVSAGGDVLFYGLGLDADGYVSGVRRWAETITDDDRDGTVSFRTTPAVPQRSLWVVVDLRNGQYSIAAPAGYPIRAAELGRSFFRRSAGGVLDVFAYRKPYLDLLYVHPGGGAWVIKSADGRPDDLDALPGLTAIPLTSARRIGTAGERPREFVPGGILVAIDFYTMTIYAGRLEGATLNGAGR